MRTNWMAIGLTALAGCSSTPPCERETEAYVMAQEFIRRDLKAPSTASFPFIGGENTSQPTTTTDGRCAFLVRVTVTAENSFGARLDQRYSVVVAPDTAGGNDWSLVSISAF